MNEAPDNNADPREIRGQVYELYLMIRLINKMFEEDFTRMAKISELTFPQYLVLLIVEYEDGLMVSKIARLGSWHISTVMSLVDRLAEKGCVSLFPVKKGKGSRVYICEPGKTIIKEVRANSPDRINRLINVIGNTGFKRNLENSQKVMKAILGSEVVNEIRQHVQKL